MKRTLGIWLSGAFCLWTGWVWGGEPIRFIRSARASKMQAQVPVRQLDKDIAKILDSIDAPSPFDGVAPAPAQERSRSRGSGPESRRVQLAREEREKWMWYDEGDLQAREEEDRAVGGRYQVEENSEGIGEERLRSKRREGSGERRSETRESRIPMHLLSPQVRQKLLAEEAAERRIRSDQAAMFREEGDPSDSDLNLRMPGKADLGRPPSPDSAANPTLRELLGGSRSSPQLRSSAPELGSLGGSELLGRPSGLGPGLDTGPTRWGSSLLERNSELGRSAVQEPSRLAPGLGAPDRLPGTFSTFGADPQPRAPIIPEVPSYKPREVPEYAPPRRGGQLGR